jgi:hypothetical protein
MLQPGSSTRSEEQEQAATLEECRRLRLLLADLLRKNHELRSQLAQARSADHFE